MDEVIDKEFILIFTINKLKLGISLRITHKVIHAIEITPLPGAPTIVDGLINIAGNAIPVINIRKRLNLKSKSIIPSDKIIVVKTDDISFAFIADEVIGLKEVDISNIKKSSDLLPETNEIIEGIVVINNEIVLIHNVNKFLTFLEKNKLKKALKKNSN